MLVVWVILLAFFIKIRHFFGKKQLLKPHFFGLNVNCRTNKIWPHCWSVMEKSGVFILPHHHNQRQQT
ncbi:MAG: hypothetical protein EAZ70_11290 [Runella slithyformis]|nr:MAG: hypothetical protein EAY79_11580 [Runella slithyformis]TAF24812.1 MAG: hypothetical protein EAZ70_11290 [Runella slithyformis]TAF49655.1 MAG: hypothetical protein EAZ63_00790 [Runella slithyformis]TAF81061.1 MAG: hypothetical protein EAZ50_07405 [Runella slithyformis]